MEHSPLIPAFRFRPELHRIIQQDAKNTLHLKKIFLITLTRNKNNKNSDPTQRIGPKVHQTGVTSPVQHRLQGARILVVDDNALMRRSLRMVLEAQDDWKVCDEASDGREAVAKFDKEKFDVIVLDFQMPGMNGLDAAKQITLRSPSTPILMVTLHHSPQLAEEARKVGIRGICAKADIECVVEGVTTILDNKSYFKDPRGQRCDVM